jgi:hypothetical protein
VNVLDEYLPKVISLMESLGWPSGTRGAAIVESAMAADHQFERTSSVQRATLIKKARDMHAHHDV